MLKKIHISIIAEKEKTLTSYYLGGATLYELSLLNAELDIVKKEILERIDSLPKEYEVEET